MKIVKYSEQTHNGSRIMPLNSTVAATGNDVWDEFSSVWH